jgi:hypothetical protein
MHHFIAASTVWARRVNNATKKILNKMLLMLLLLPFQTAAIAQCLHGFL